MLNEKREIDGTLYVFDEVIKKDDLHGRMITSLIAPNVISIEDDAIYRCPNLKKITAQNLQKIGDNIAEDCPSLVEVEAPLLKEQGIVFFGSLFIDLNNKKILNLGDFGSKLVHVLNEELQKGNKLSILEKEEGIRVLKLDENEILKEKDGKIKGICLPTCLTFPAHALYENNFVEELILLSATNMDHNAVYKAKALKKVVGSHLKTVRFSNFSRCPSLEEVHLPELEVLGEACFCYDNKLSSFSFDKLESVEKNCFCFLPEVEVFCLKNAEFIGEGSLQSNEKMKAVLLPELVEIERGVLYNSQPEYLYAPKTRERAVRIKYLKNAKQLIKGKDILRAEYRGRIKE